MYFKILGDNVYKVDSPVQDLCALKCVDGKCILFPGPLEQYEGDVATLGGGEEVPVNKMIPVTRGSSPVARKISIDGVCPRFMYATKLGRAFLNRFVFRRYELVRVPSAERICPIPAYVAGYVLGFGIEHDSFRGDMFDILVIRNCMTSLGVSTTWKGDRMRIVDVRRWRRFVKSENLESGYEEANAKQAREFSKGYKKGASMNIAKKIKECVFPNPVFKKMKRDGARTPFLRVTKVAAKKCLHLKKDVTYVGGSFVYV